jgi:DNA invertase Pin-like site-specific DNA recombinase
LQLTALKRAGYQRIFTDTASGTHVKRPELVKCLKALKEGNMLDVSRRTLDQALQGQFEFAGGLVIR